MLLHHAAAVPCSTSPSTDLGIVVFPEIARALHVSIPTLERIIRNDPTFPRLFKIGNRRHVLRSELQGWVDRKARGDA